MENELATAQAAGLPAFGRPAALITEQNILMTIGAFRPMSFSPDEPRGGT
jgi:hypothetical protein